MDEEVETVAEQGQQVEPQGSMSTWSDWDVHFVPYPAVLAELGFESILSRITEAVWDEPLPLARWGDIGLSGQFDKVVTLSCEEMRDGTPEEFLRDVAEFMLGLELEGHLMVQRVFSVMRSPVLYDGDEDGE